MLNLKLCNLVVHTDRGICVIDVPFDEKKWNEIESKLKQFYLSYMVQATLDLL